jgi:putative component of membrane protein insertase Oxa1/YidC/SpoIIIJ protein YidD
MRRVLAVALLAGVAGSATARYDAFSVAGGWLINVYKNTASPVQAPDICNFWPTCSQFTRRAVQEHGLLLGTLIGADRITRCNPQSWRLLGTSYAGGIAHLRIVDPPENHLAWSETPGQPEPASAPRVGADSTAGSGLEYAEHLLRTGHSQAAAEEFLRVRFTTSDPDLRRYSGLLAAESYLAAGDCPAARHAFADATDSLTRDLARFGVARAFFAEGSYDSTLAALDCVTNGSLAPPAVALSVRALFRQHRFAAAAEAGASLADCRAVAEMNGSDLPRRSRLVGSLLSAVVPGTGQFYAGRVGDALYSFLAVLGPGAVTWWYASDAARRDPTHLKTVLFGTAAGVFYSAGIYGANLAARDYNALAARRYAERADELLGRIRLTPDYRTLLSPGR